MLYVIKDTTSLERFRIKWDTFSKDFNSPLAGFDWHYCCVKQLCPDNNFIFLILEENNEIKAIAPLEYRKLHGIIWLELLGSTRLYEPQRLLCKTAEYLEQLIQAIIKLGYPVVLKRLYIDNNIMASIKNTARRKAYCHEMSTIGSYFINTDTSWDTFYKQIGKNWRADFRNKLNRAQKNGGIELETFTPDEQTTTELLSDCFRIEASSWKSRTKTALVNDDNLRNFITCVATHFASQTRLIIFFLKIGTKRVAMHIGLIHERELWFLKMGYDEKWTKFSPGMQLAHMSIKYAFDNNFERYEFLGSEEAWQRAWPVNTHKYSTILLYPYTIKGLLGFIISTLIYMKNKLCFIK